jgi:hypothetical protein
MNTPNTVIQNYRLVRKLGEGGTPILGTRWAKFGSRSI